MSIYTVRFFGHYRYRVDKIEDDRDFHIRSYNVWKNQPNDTYWKCDCAASANSNECKHRAIVRRCEIDGDKANTGKRYDSIQREWLAPLRFEDA